MKLKQFIFALVAMLSSFAFTANAANGNVAKVGNTEYATIDEAIANWIDGTTLTLLANVTLSDVVKINSNESRTLDLGIFTMTAASGKDAFQYVVKGCTSDVGLIIKADATNPGGITAVGKSIIVHEKPKSNAPEKDRPYTQFYGGVFNAANIVKQFGWTKGLIWDKEGAGYTGASAPRFVFHGGVFNGDIRTNRSLVQIKGGTFNGKFYTSFDSSSWGNIQGGKFKYLSNLAGSNLDEKIAQGVNNYKFTIGSAKMTYDRGIYVDAEGYYVITSAPITEVSAKYPAVYKTTYNGDNYFYYSAAQEYGLFYEDVDMAIEKHGGANVTVWEKPAVTITIPEDVTGESTVVEEIKNNTVLEDYTPENLPEDATLEIVLESVGETIVYEVAPKVDGVKVEPTEAITFRLPVPARVTKAHAKVYHEGTLMGIYEIKGEGNAKYVEISSADFSEFAVEPVSVVAQIGEHKYATLADAIAAAQSVDEIVIIADVELTETTEFPADKTITLNLNNKEVSVADKNVVKNSGAALTIKNGTIKRTGTVAGYAVNVVSGTLEVEDVTIVGGLYTSGTSLVATNTNISQASASRHAIYAYNCAVTINSGTYHNDNAGNAAVFAYGSSVVTINNGTFSIDNGKQTFGWTSCLLDANAGGKYVINGGEFKGHFRVQANSAMEINGGTFENTHNEAYAIYGTAVVKGGTFTDDAAKKFATSNLADGYEVDENGTVAKASVAEVNGTKYTSLAEAAAAAQAGDEIVMLANVTLAEALTLPAGITLNGNGKQINGTIIAAGDITFAGVTKAGDLDFAVGNTVVNIPAGASLQLNGSARMSIGFGTTFNIVGTIEDAKTADKATVVPSLVIPGASFSGAGVKFNVTNAYISVPSSYCSTSKSASGTFDFNITNSIWESAGKLAFEEQSVNAKVDFALVNSVLTTGSHLVFGTASGEEGVVIDNSYVNKGTSRQLENCGTMTVKNRSVVNGAVATSSNAKNPGTVIVENATYAVTGEFSGSDLGTGTLVIKKDANVSVGSIKDGANVTVDATGMAAGDVVNFTADLSKFAGELSVINNDKLEAKIVDGKIVLAAKPVATVNGVGYATLEEAFAAATEGATITLLDDATPALASQRAITKAAVIDLGDKTLTLTEDDLYFGTTTFQNGKIVVDSSVKPSTAVFWMFANQTLTFDNVKIVATGVTGTYLIGLDGNNSDLNLLNGSEILVENTTALDLDIICVNASTGNDIKVENSKVNVTNLDGRVFFRGNYTVAGNSEINLAGITKAGFRIEAGQTLSIEGTSKVNITGEPRDGGIHLTDASANYTKAETATVNATVNEPAKGSITPAYTGETSIWGEGGGNAKQSLVVKLYSNETPLATASLNNIGGIINGNVYVSWNIPLNSAGNDEYWNVVWDNSVTAETLPTKVVMVIDGVEVAENNFQLNSPDDLNKIVAAVTDADGKIISCHTSVANAVDANAQYIALLRNTEESIMLPNGVTLNTNGFTANNVTTPVAQINGFDYPTLIAAINAVQDGETITLIANEIFTATNYSNNGGWKDGVAYSGDKSFTIDLNGFTVSQDGYLNDYLFWFKNVGSKKNTITIKNGTLDAGTTAFCALCTASSHENQLTINTENLTLINNKSDGSTVKVRAGSVLNVKAGTVITGKNSYLGIESWKATVNIYEGAKIYMNGTASYNGCLVGVGGNGEINVYGGYGKGVKGGFIAMTSGGTINISGGEWIANTDGTVGNNSNLYVLTAQSNSLESGFAGGSYINVTGGTFRGGMDAWVLDASKPEEEAGLSICGGNFNVNPSRYVEAGYLASEANGIYTVAKAVAKIGDVYYATIQAAINAAQNGDTVVILAGEYGAINISNKNITIQGTVGENGELLTTIKGGNPAITGHGFNGTIKDLNIVDAFKVMYAEPAGNVTVDNVNVTGATYGLHLVAYSTDLTWTIQNSYMDLSWANSFGVYGDGDAAIVVKGNQFESTNPYYPDYGALAVNTFLPNVTVEENIFGENTKILIRDLADLSNINISNNYHADGVENAFTDDSKEVHIESYYANPDLTGFCFVIDDAKGLKYERTEDIRVSKLTYKRTLALGVWNPLYVPFEVSIEELCENYDIAYYNQILSYDKDNDGVFEAYDMELAMLTSGTVRANYPLFIRPKNDEACTLVYEAEDITLYAAKEYMLTTSSASNIFELCATYKGKSLEDLSGYLTMGASGWTTPNAGLKPGRMYLKISSNSNNPFAPSSYVAKSARIVVRGEEGTTDVEGVVSEPVENVIYDLNGRRVLEAEKAGIYIINGKKVLVK